MSLFLKLTWKEVRVSYWLVLQFKAKDSEIKKYPLCLGNASKDFTIDHTKKAGLKRSVNIFSVDYRSINTDQILDTHKYLMKELS